MRDVVRRLQDGWYGNETPYQPCDDEFTRGTSCAGLVRQAIKCADTEYVPLCAGLEGAIGTLQVDQAHQPDHTEASIDAYLEMVAVDDDWGEGKA